ncbi:MAG: DUF5719 family protein, partial [Nocardioides sp.]
MSRVRDVVAGLAVLVCAAALLVAGGTDSSVSVPPRKSATVAPLDVTLSCPESLVDAATTTSVFAVSPNARDGSGSLELSVLQAATARPLGTEEAARVPLVQQLTTAAEPSVLAVAEGRRAAGTTAYQFSTSTGGQRSGLAVSGCDRPADQWWFNGVGTQVGTTSRLVLANPSPGVAVVDVLIYGPKGRVQAAGSRGIPLGPWSRRSLNLARFAPGLSPATVQVRTQRGRVVAAVNTTRISGVTPAGSEWVSASTPPRTDLVVNGGPAGQGERALVIANPGRHEALVQVQAMTSSGPFQPTALADLRVRPGSVLVTDVTAIADRASTSWRLVSTVPVTGGVEATTGAPRPDFAVTGASPALGAPAVVALEPQTALTLCANTAERGTGRVAIERVGPDGASLGREKLLVLGGSTTCRVMDGAAEPAYLVVSADAADAVHVVATYTGRDGVAS